MRLRFSLTNVMKAADLSEYTGELRAQLRRAPDRQGGRRLLHHAGLPVSFERALRPHPRPPGRPSACELDTTLDALIPGAAAEGTRAIWALDKLRVYDGGPDGDGDTEADNSLFATQGVFVP